MLKLSLLYCFLSVKQLLQKQNPVIIPQVSFRSHRNRHRNSKHNLHLTMQNFISIHQQLCKSPCLRRNRSSGLRAALKTVPYGQIRKIHHRVHNTWHCYYVLLRMFPAPSSRTLPSFLLAVFAFTLRITDYRRVIGFLQ